MNKRNQPRKCSITNNIIWPLLYFMAGIMVASSFLGGHNNEGAVVGAVSEPCREELKPAEQHVSSLESELATFKGEMRACELALSGMTAQRDEWEKKVAEKQKGNAEEEAARAASVAEEADWSEQVVEEQAWAVQLAASGKEGGGRERVSWSPLNKWHTTELEPLSFSKAFDIGLPIDTIKWSGGFLMMPTIPPTKKGGGAVAGGLEEKGTALDHIHHSCSELDVIVLNDQHCVAVTHVNGLQARQNTPYHVSRFEKGVKVKKDNGGGGEGEGGEGSEQFTLVSRLGAREGAPPSPPALKTHRRSLGRFFASVDEVEAELDPVLKRAAQASAHNVVVTMTFNAGMGDLFLNFVCSAKKHQTEGVLESLVLFPTDQEAVEVAKSMGVAHYRHKSFGEFPTEEAGSYGDNTFVAMMWMKVLCVYLPVNLGYNVLFQDADVVWLRDPISEFFALPHVAGDFDVYFQDDGSRSTRFSPYFSNSGFYFLRQSPRTKYFMTMLLMQGDTILEWRSHQSALVQVLADASSKFGLRVKTLSYKDFPSGKDYHHRKPYMQAWAKGEEAPYAFHMCWTQNKVDKVKYLKQLGGWFLHPTCSQEAIRTPELQAKGALQNTCCSAEPVVECFFRDKASAVPCKDSPNKDKGQPSWW